MPHCYVVGCLSSDRRRPDGVSFHKIPQNQERVWLPKIGRESCIQVANQRVCSCHFLQDDFLFNQGTLRRLKPDVYPSLNLPIPPPQEPPSICETVQMADTLTTLPNISECDVRSQRPELKRKFSFDLGAFRSPLKRINSAGCTISDSPKSGSGSLAYSGTSSYKRRIIKSMHNYSLGPDHYRKLMIKFRERADFYERKLRGSQKTCGRRKKKISHLKQIVVDVKKKYNLSSSLMNILEGSFSGVPLLMMKRMLVNKKNEKTSRIQYPKELRSFAMTLQFCSSKAYEYVRKCFDFTIPAQSTIRSWFVKIDCSPGYTRPSLEALKKRSAEFKKKHNNQLLCSLVLDEMAIKKEVVVQRHTGIVWGYTDVGSDLPVSNERDLATEVLVLMVVGINDHFKIPIAYFFISKMTGEEKANLIIQTLTHIYQTGARILSVTCDGPSVNFKMMAELGCNVRDVNNLKTYFSHPVDKSKVYVLFDICHMLKLVRNNWANSGTFLNSSGQEIAWDYIERLHEIQNENNLYLGNKLRKKHIEWRQAKMKVNLAAQTLSNSVAVALEYLCKDLQLEEFADVMATVEFIKTFDQLFDLLNSRNPFAKGMKTPLRPENESYWRPFLNQAVSYIKGCTTCDKIPVYETLKRVPFLGFLIAINSFLAMYDEEVKEKKSLKYILTYKCSQDHLELFFCGTRSRNGSNNNPNCMQFMHSYRRLLVHQDIKTNSGNCLIQDQTECIQITDVNYQRRQVTERSEAEDLQEIIDIIIPETLHNEYAENVVSYISGFVVRSIRKTLKCSICYEVLGSLDIESDNLKFTNRKNCGGLTIPSASVTKICSKVDKKISVIYKLLGNIPPVDTLKYLFSRESQIFLDDSYIFPELVDHVADQSLYETSHRKILIDMIVSKYISIRLNSLARKINEDIGVNVRKTLSKLILFKHQ